MQMYNVSPRDPASSISGQRFEQLPAGSGRIGSPARRAATGTCAGGRCSLSSLLPLRRSGAALVVVLASVLAATPASLLAQTPDPSQWYSAAIGTPEYSLDLLLWSYHDSIDGTIRILHVVDPGGDPPFTAVYGVAGEVAYENLLYQVLYDLDQSGYLLEGMVTQYPVIGSEYAAYDADPLPDVTWESLDPISISDFLCTMRTNTSVYPGALDFHGSGRECFDCGGGLPWWPCDGQHCRGDDWQCIDGCWVCVRVSGCQYGYAIDACKWMTCSWETGECFVGHSSCHSPSWPLLCWNNWCDSSTGCESEWKCPQPPLTSCFHGQGCHIETGECAPKDPKCEPEWPDLCTRRICNAGVCEDINKCDSEPAGACVVSMSCDTSTGECVHTQEPDGCCSQDSDCDDGNACTIDSCVNGVPVRGTYCEWEEVDCGSGDACDVIYCHPIDGCIVEPRDCDDGLPCTIDTCDPVDGCQWEDVDCDDGDPCTLRFCNQDTGECETRTTIECVDDLCRAACCDDGQCEYQKKPQTAGISGGPAKVCASETDSVRITLSGGTCDATYSWWAEFDPPDDVIELVSGSGSVSIPAGGSAYVYASVGVYADAELGDESAFRVVVENYSNGSCLGPQTGHSEATIDVEVAGVDLDIDSDNNSAAPFGAPQRTEAEEEIEEISPKLILLNCDDDDDDGTPDMDQVWPNVPPADDDLVAVALEFVAPDNADRWRLTYAAQTIKVWDTSAKQNLIASGVPYDLPMPTELYVEGVAPGEGVIELEMLDWLTVLCTEDTVAVAVISRCSEAQMVAEPPEVCPGETVTFTVSYDCPLDEQDAPAWVVGTNTIALVNGVTRVSDRRFSLSLTVLSEFVGTGWLTVEAIHPNDANCNQSASVSVGGSMPLADQDVGDLSSGGGDCGGASCEDTLGHGSVVLGSVQATFSLGRDGEGRSAGSLLLRAEEPMPDLAQRSALACYSGPDRVDRVYDSRGLRQLATSGMLVDIVDVHVDETGVGDEYELRFYSKDQFTDVPGEYGTQYSVVSGEQPPVKWVVRDPADARTLQLEKWVWDESDAEHILKARFDYTFTEYTPDVHWQWELALYEGAEDEDSVLKRTEVAEWEYDANVGNWTRTFRATKDTLLIKESRQTWREFPWGRSMVEQAVSPGASYNDRVTTFAYYESGASAGKLGLIARPDGSWVGYAYGSDTVTQIAGWKDTPVPASVDDLPAHDASGVRSVQLTPVTAANSPSAPAAAMGRAKYLKTYTDGIRTSSLSYSYSEPDSGVLRIEETADDGDAGLVTVEEIETDHGDRLRSTWYPDGQYLQYQYDQGLYLGSAAVPPFGPDANGPHHRVRVSHGHSLDGSSITLIDGKSTQGITVYDERGLGVYSAVYVAIQGTFDYDEPPVAWTDSVYDNRSRIIDGFASNGTRRSVQWAEHGCCGSRTSTDAAGVKTLSATDSWGRLSGLTLLGTAGAAPPWDSELSMSYVYRYEDVAGDVERVVEATVSSQAGGTPDYTTSSHYDLLGRLLKHTNEANLDTLYAYGGTAEGGETVTITYPGGATEIVAYYRDGKARSVGGTAVVPQAFQYAVMPDGCRSRTSLVGTDDHEAVDWPRWAKTTYDKLGRVRAEEQPGYPDGASTSEYVYDGQGQLIRRVRTGRADVLFEYDDLGRLELSGLDVDGDGWNLASNDRVVEWDWGFVLDGANWWYEATATQYTVSGSTADRIEATDSRRLTGFDYQETNTVSGESKRVVKHWATGFPEPIATEMAATVTETDRSEQKVTVTSIRSGVGNAATAVLRYGSLESIASPTGSSRTYAYDGLRRQSAVTDGRGNATTTEYDDNTGRVLAVQNAGGGRSAYGYDSATGRLTKVEQLAAAETPQKPAVYVSSEFAYNDRGQVIKTWGGVPRRTWIEYDAFGQPVRLHTYRDDDFSLSGDWPTGDVTTWAYHAGTGLLQSKTDAAGQAVTYDYTPEGRLETRTWARTFEGQPLETTYTYDPNTGELLTVNYSNTDYGAAEPDLTYTYTRAGRLETVTDANPDGTDHSFDYSQSPTQVTETISGLYDRTLTRTYDDEVLGRPLGLTSGTDYAVGYSYDSSTGRFERVTGPGLPSTGAVYSYLEDTGIAVADLVSVVDFYDGATRVASVDVGYDVSRNLVTTIGNTWDPDGNNTPISQYDYTYDILGRRVSRYASVPSQMWLLNLGYQYTSRNELEGVSVWGWGGGGWSYEYDGIGNRTLAARLLGTEPMSRQTYVSNELNQYVRVAGAVGMPQHPSYDADGNLASAGLAADMNGDEVVDQTDFNLFVAEFSGPDQGRDGQLSLSAPNLDSDDSGLRTSPPSPDGPVWQDATLRAEVHLPNGGPRVDALLAHTTYELHYAADADAVSTYLLTAMTDTAEDGLAETTAPVSGPWQDTGNFVLGEIPDQVRALSAGQANVPAGFYTTHVVADSQATGSFAAPQGVVCTFTTGPAGQLCLDLEMHLLELVPGEFVRMRQQLTLPVSASVASRGSLPYGLFWPSQLAVTSWALLSSRSGADFDGDGDVDLFDLAGLVRSFGQPCLAYQWDAENRLLAIPPANPQDGDTKVEFGYDYLGRRTVKRVYTWDEPTSSWGSPTAVTKFVYDGWRVIMELDGLNSDAISRKHTWGLDLSGSLEGAGGIGGLLGTYDTLGTAQINDDRTFLYFYDANGNVGQLVETTAGPNYGVLAAHYDYTPYGQVLSAAGDYADQPFRFSTKWIDEETGLGYWGHRYYSPELGRWLSRDPIGEAGGLNLYEYALSSPQQYIDPLGYAIGDWWDPRTYATFGEALWEVVVESPAEAITEEHRSLEGDRTTMGYGSAVGIMFQNLPANQIAAREAMVARLEDRLPDYSIAHTALDGTRFYIGLDEMTDGINGVDLSTGKELSGEERATLFANGLSRYTASAAFVVGSAEGIAKACQSSRGGVPPLYEPEVAFGLADDAAEAAAGGSGAATNFPERYLSGSGGRWGGAPTRALNHELATELESQGYRIIGGAGRASEEWIPGVGGGVQGGTWVDITATNGTNTIRIQTISTLADGVTATPAEAAAAARIRAAFPGDQLRLVPKR